MEAIRASTVGHSMGSIQRSLNTLQQDSLVNQPSRHLRYQQWTLWGVRTTT